MRPKKSKEQTDEELAKLVQQGNSTSFDVLVERYEQKLLRYGNKFLYNYEDVEDAVQEVFLKCYKNIQSFNTKKRFSPWIYRVAHNTFINIIRKNKREPLSFFDPDTFFARSIKAKEDTEKKADEHFNRKLTKKYLRKLKPKYREPLILHYIEEKTYKEISDILCIPISTVGVRINRAKELVRKTNPKD